MRRLLIVPLLATSFAVAAQDLDAARALYDRGAMLKAAELARGFDSAEGHVLASQATLVAAIYQRRDHDDELLRQAADDARTALALDPNHVQAHLQLALALGYLAEDDPLGAHLNGTAREGKELLERALALAPDDPWAHGMLGVWHLRVVRHAGPMLAETMYAASIEEGRAQCDEAAGLGPDLLPVRFGCAVGLLEVDPKRHLREAIEILEIVVRLPADDAATQLIQADARRRLDTLKAGAWEGFGADPVRPPRQ